MSTLTGLSPVEEISDTGVGWPAILGGALGVLGLMLILVPLGGGLGLALSAPWNRDGDFGHTFTVAAAIWLIIVQWISAAFGGYLTGRLRTGWPGAHTHEVYFRDTVHGFFAWALASVLGAMLIFGAASHGAPKMAAADGASYFSDSLFRNGTTSAGVTDADRAEARRILTLGVADGSIPEGDRNYLVELISTRTGMTPADANARVDTVLGHEKLAVKNAGKASFFLSLSMLIGAFIAAAAGALGGLHRDTHYAHGKLRL